MGRRKGCGNIKLGQKGEKKKTSGKLGAKGKGTARLEYRITTPTSMKKNIGGERKATGRYLQT